MRFASFKRSLCLVLAGVLSAGTPLLAVGPVEMRSSDIAITDGLLVGTVLNTAAKPVAGLNVRLMHSDRVIATVTSDENGQFSVRGLRNGGHVLVVGDTRQAVRLWSEQAAPPTAVSGMAIIVDEEVVRGQECEPSMGALLPVGLFIGGAIAGTLAFTLHDQKDDQPASP